MLAGSLDIGGEGARLSASAERHNRLAPSLVGSLALHLLLALALILAASHLLRPPPELAAFRVELMALGTAGVPPGDQESEPARKSAAEQVAALPAPGATLEQSPSPVPAPSRAVPTESSPSTTTAPDRLEPDAASLPPGATPSDAARLEAAGPAHGRATPAPATRPVAAKPSALAKAKPSLETKDTARALPAPAPAATPPAADLAARLAALTRQQQALAQSRPRPPTDDDPGSPSGLGRVSGSARYDAKDFIRAQIERRWVPDLSGSPGRYVVAVHVTIDRDGTVRAAEIVDNSRGSDPAYRALAMSARNAVLLSSPLALPPGRYEEVRDVVLEFDPRKVSR
jgi:hypothetical protein